MGQKVKEYPAPERFSRCGVVFALAGDEGVNRLVLSPAGDFLLAQKVTKDAQETNGFLTSFSVDKRGICRTWPKFSIVRFSAPLPLTI